MHLTHDDLVLHYYGEARADARRIDAHLASCDDCRAALSRLQRTLALVETSDEGEPPAGYEATMWARLQDQLEPRRPSWRARLGLDGGRWALAAGTAAIAGVAFYAGWQAREIAAPAPPVTTAAATAAAPESTRARVLAMAVGDHLDRAQVVLSEVANGDADDATALTAERLRASDLVATNRLVRQTAAMSGDDALDGVLEALERALVDIANAPDDLSADDWRALRARIDTQGLLFRVRVLSDELRAGPARPASPRPKGKTS